MFKDEYRKTFDQVTASEQTYEKVMQMAKTKKPRRFGSLAGKVLLAAVLIMGLAVTASAAEAVFGWFTQYFGGADKLDPQQIQYLEDRTQTVPTAQAEPEAPDNPARTDVLQFIKDEVTVPVDVNNTHLAGTGEPNYQNVRLHSLLLSEEDCRLFFYLYPGMDTMEAASLPEITVVLSSGEQLILPVVNSKSTYIQFRGEESIPLEQVSHILLPDGTRLDPKNRVDDGYDITVDSLLTDGKTAYVTLNVTLPEYIEPPGEGWVMDHRPGTYDFWFCPGDQEKATIEDILHQEVTGRLVDMKEGDGNTYTMVYSMSNENFPQGFAPGSQWKIHIDGLQTTWHNPEGQALIESRYAGQDYIVDGEEAELAMRFEQICWDKWDFLLTIGENMETEQELELVTEPVTLTGYRGATIDEIMANPEKQEYGPCTIQLVSLKISPLSYWLDYTSADPKTTYTVDPGNFYLVMKDGTQIEMFWTHQRHRFEQPIILSEADYVLCPDGTKLPISR